MTPVILHKINKTKKPKVKNKEVFKIMFPFQNLDIQ
jgi:hypothetical protein